MVRIDPVWECSLFREYVEVTYIYIAIQMAKLCWGSLKK